MPTLPSRSYDLGGGISLETDIIANFQDVAGKARLAIPDPALPSSDPRYSEIKGTLRVFADGTPATIQVKANYTLRGGQPCNVGFKQVGRIQYDAGVYSGTSSSEGSITAHTSGMNGVWMLDCSAIISASSFRAVDVPFYVTRTLSSPGAKKQMQMEDRPGGQRVFVQRRNHKSDRLNYLVNVSQRYDFVTFVVVELPGGKHIPVKGFSWNYQRTIDLVWVKSYPRILADNGWVSFDSWLDPLPASDPRSSLFSDPSVRASATLDARYAQALFTLILSGSSPDYAVDEYPNLSTEAAAATNARAGWFSEN